MPFTSAMLLGVAGGAGFDATVTFPSFSGGTAYGLNSTPIVVDDPDSIIQGVIFYSSQGGIKLENGASYEVSVIQNYSSATGTSFVLGEATHDSGSEFQNYNLEQTIGTLWTGSSFNNFVNTAFTCSTSGGGFGPALVIKHPTSSSSATGTLKLGITKTS